MKKIVYIAFTDIHHSSGVFKKITGQIEALRSIGNEVVLLAIKGYAVYELTCKGKKELSSSELLNSNGRIRRILTQRIKVYSTIFKYLLNSEFEYIYLRYPPVLDPLLIRLLRKAPQKVIIEHQTISISEKKLSGNKVRYLAELLWGNSFIKLANAHICVTNEIANHIKRKTTKPVNVIPNGIDVDSIPIRKYEKKASKKINLLFVGNIMPHHGLDRIIKGLSRYSAQNCFHIDVIGPNYSTYKEKATDYRVSDMLVFHGAKGSQHLNEFYNKADLAIGSLAHHRKMLSETSTLKVREYAARGIPFILAGNDSDLPVNNAISDFYLQVPLNDEPLDFSQIERFSQNIEGEEQIIAVEMNKYAKDNFSYSSKMRTLSRFLSNL